MASLLDIFGTTPEQTQAIGLLGAGLMAGNPAAAFANASGFLSGADDRKLKRSLLEMQAENYRSEIEQRKAAIQRQQRIQDAVAGLLGGSAPAQPGQMGSGSFGLLSAPAGQADMPRGGLSGASLEQIAGLQAMGGPNLMDAYKFARQGIERKPGNFYEDMQGRREFVPNIENGMDYQNGRINEIPGYSDFLTRQTLAQKGPEALIGAAARVNLRRGDNNKEYPVSELDENQTLQRLLSGYMPGGMTAAPAATAAPISAPQMAGRPTIAPADQKAADAESITMIQAELQNPQLPPDQRAGLQRELSRLTASQSQPGFPTPSLVRPTPAQGYGKTSEQQTADEVAKTEATTRAEIRVKDLEDMRKNIAAAGFSAPQRIAKYQQLGALLSDVDGGKLTATGTNLASAMNSLGLKIDKNLPNKEAAAALGNEMALQLRSPASGAGMPGAMSDKDREFLVGMIPNASQTLEGRKMLIQAQVALAQREQQIATFMRNYEKKYGKLDNGFFEQMQAWSEANPLFKGQ